MKNIETTNPDRIKFIYAYIKYLVDSNNYILDRFNLEKHYYSIVSNIENNSFESENHITFNNDFSEELNNFVMCGYLRPMKTNKNFFYILNYNKNYYIDEYINIMIKKLLEIDILAKKYENLEVILSNPNGRYNILVGNVDDKIVAWDIFTDGEVSKGNIQLIKGSNFARNPEDNSKIRLDRLSREIVNVRDSSYVIKQGLINDIVTLNTLYTSIDNLDEIDEIASQYCKKKI